MTISETGLIAPRYRVQVQEQISDPIFDREQGNYFFPSYWYYISMGERLTHACFSPSHPFQKESETDGKGGRGGEVGREEQRFIGGIFQARVCPAERDTNARRKGGRREEDACCSCLRRKRRMGEEGKGMSHVVVQARRQICV